MQTGRLKVLVAMSGGVDSSVAAFLLQQQGCECAGLTMRLQDCCEADDGIRDAQAVCCQLGISHHVLDAGAEFREKVVDRFVATYCQGATPNPCIECNRNIKFKLAIDAARQRGFDAVATGHYARIELGPDGRHVLKAGADPHKDQSYALYGMTQEQLAFTRFPLGCLTKEQVREVAAEQGLRTAEKGESQDICFIPEGDYAGFIRSYLTGSERPGLLEASMRDALQPGPIVNEKGDVLGAHGGIVNFTIGQRKGLCIAASEALYVKQIDAATSTVIVAPRSCLGKTTALLDNVNILAVDDMRSAGQPVRAFARHRYRCTPQPVTVVQPDATTLKVVYNKPVPDLARGQALVLYDPIHKENILAGGTITETQ